MTAYGHPSLSLAYLILDCKTYSDDSAEVRHQVVPVVAVVDADNLVLRYSETNTHWTTQKVRTCILSNCSILMRIVTAVF